MRSGDSLERLPQGKEAACRRDGPHGSCSVCGDEAIRARVLTVDPGTATATVDAGGSEVDVSLIDAVVPGDVVIVHAGVAVGKELGP